MTGPENLRCTICLRDVDSVEELRILPTAPMQVRFCAGECAPVPSEGVPGAGAEHQPPGASLRRTARGADRPWPQRRAAGSLRRGGGEGGDEAAGVHRRCPRAPVRVAGHRRPDAMKERGLRSS